jgi:hypothetical protein
MLTLEACRAKLRLDIQADKLTGRRGAALIAWSSTQNRANALAVPEMDDGRPGKLWLSFGVVVGEDGRRFLVLIAKSSLSDVLVPDHLHSQSFTSNTHTDATILAIDDDTLSNPTSEREEALWIGRWTPAPTPGARESTRTLDGPAVAAIGVVCGTETVDCLLSYNSSRDRVRRPYYSQRCMCGQGSTYAKGTIKTFSTWTNCLAHRRHLTWDATVLVILGAGRLEP